MAKQIYGGRLGPTSADILRRIGGEPEEVCKLIAYEGRAGEIISYSATGLPAMLRPPQHNTVDAMRRIVLEHSSPVWRAIVQQTVLEEADDEALRFLRQKVADQEVSLHIVPSGEAAQDTDLLQDFILYKYTGDLPRAVFERCDGALTYADHPDVVDTRTLQAYHLLDERALGSQASLDWLNRRIALGQQALASV